jgi:HAD superfamily hydrolase (TIGR01450 family)
MSAAAADSASDAGLLRGSAGVLARDYDVALLDLDGVVYDGPDAVPTAPAALAAARAAGMRLTFVTNNAARPPDAVAAHLTDLGVPADPAEVVNSAQVAAHYLADRLPPGAPVLVVGSEGLYVALRERGLTPVGSAADDPQAVVQGYSPALDWALLAEGCVAIRRGVPWVATNLDATVPSPRGPLPGNGSMVVALQHATGVVPVSTGKPEPTMHRETVERSGATRPIVVGDRLDTDIEGARRVGCDSLLVFTGVTSPAGLLRAAAQYRPTYIGHDLRALLTAHPAVHPIEGGARCGGWTAVRDGSLLRLSAAPKGAPSATMPAPPPAPSARDHGPADDLDPVRALCGAAWATPEGREWAVTGADDRSRAALDALGI